MIAKTTKLCIAFLLLSTFSFAQNNSKIGLLSATVLDSSTQKPIEYASLKLLNPQDSSVRGGVYSDEKGKFLLDEIALGKYLVKVNATGYTDVFISNVTFSNEKPTKDLGTILLSLEKIKIEGEVTIVGNRDKFLNNIDKKVYDVEKDINVKGGTANDVLNNVPSVEIDQEGKISLRGEGNVTILIDGRPSSITGGNGKSLLDALPANSIERIEIVSNPSAKYDPDGTAGIINIVLKKNKLRGINGNVAISAGTGNVYNVSTGLSFRNTKYNVYGTYSYRYYEGFRNYESDLYRTLSTDTFRLIQDRKGTDLMINNTARFGTDFYLNDRNTLGFSLTANISERERTGDLTNTQYTDYEESAVDRLWKRNASDPNQNQTFDLNVNYKLDFLKDKGSLSSDFTHSRGTDQNQGVYMESYETNAGIPDLSLDLLQRLDNQDQFNVTTAQIDMVRFLPKSIKWELGAKGIFRNSSVNTYSETFDYSISDYREDTVANFSYTYSEQLLSAYTNLGSQYKKWKYQAGARFEQASQIPSLVGDTTDYKNVYFNIFPSAFLKYEVSKAIELSFSYSKRINRPTAEQLNPFTSYADPYNLRMGNPALKPEYIHSFDAGMTFNSKKVSLTMSAFYRRTNSVLTRIKFFYENGATAVTYANIDNSVSFGPEIVLIYRPFTWMKNTLSMTGNGIQYFDDTPNYNWNNSGFFWSAKYAGTFDYWKKTATLQINAQYNSPRITPQGKVQPRASMDIATDKMLKEKWTIGFRLSDIFNTQEFRLHVVQPGSEQIARFKQNTRRFYINISYKFGKYELKKPKGGSEGGGGMDF